MYWEKMDSLSVHACMSVCECGGSWKYNRITVRNETSFQLHTLFFISPVLQPPKLLCIPFSLRIYVHFVCLPRKRPLILCVTLKIPVLA